MLQQALTFFQSGHPDKAEAILPDLLQLPLDSAPFLNQLGILSRLLGHEEKGLELLQRSVEKDPSAPFLSNLGLALEQSGRRTEAETCYRQAILEDHAFAPAHFNLGNVLQATGRNEAAVDAYQDAINASQDYAAAHTNLANAFAALDRLDEAEASCRRALLIAPESPETLRTWCEVLHRMDGGSENILLKVDQLAAMLPGGSAPLCYGQMGEYLADIGAREAALQLYDRALKKTDQVGKVFLRMVILHSFQPGDPLIGRMQKALADFPDMTDRNMLCFALGRALEETGEYADAFAYIQEANRLTRAAYTYSTDEDRLFFAQLKKSLPAGFPVRQVQTSQRDVHPLFVIGMPRSGTTLIEQILASHSQVHGAGELTELDRQVRQALLRKNIHDFPGGIIRLDPEDIREVGERYLTSIRSLAPGAPFIVDKMPHNFLWAGMIHLALPGARIIHCRRNPMDTCWSIYKNIFDIPHKYAQELTELGHYYRYYLDLMAHWHRIMPETIHEVKYERLLHDQEQETRRLLAFCHLPWEDACLSFHRSQTRVSTSSMAQVRNPLYNDSLGKWKHYEQELAPLQELLHD